MAKVINTIDMSKLTKIMGTKTVLVGYPQGRPHANSDMEMHELAKKNTYGGDGVPSRPFLEPGIWDGRKEIEKAIEEYNKKLVNQEDTEMALKKIGALCVGSVQEYVRGDTLKETVPNSPVTIARKSKKKGGKLLVSDKPLIDTADMINDTTFIIRKNK